MNGPLDGVRVVEFASMGPGPFAGMMLADLGADVIRIERSQPDGRAPRWPGDILCRGRRSVALDLKREDDVAAARALVDRADVLLEGFRPGVMERLGVGPDECSASNPRLVYGRMTGWGQDGPLAQRAGHDINYIALAGVLHPIGPADRPPTPPLNLVGDFGGGGMLLAFGIVCALFEAQTSGVGQVVDASMVEGAALLGTMVYGFAGLGQWKEQRGANLLDGGAPFYRNYVTADGGFLAVGAIEPQFYAELLRLTGLDEDPTDQMVEATWPRVSAKLEATFASASRDTWCDVFAGSDACVAPVLSIWEASSHPHNVARATFVEIDGVVQPSPAPRFSRTPGRITAGIPGPGEHTLTAPASWGVVAKDA